MDTQAELNVSEAKPVLESEVNCDSFGLDSAHNAKINTTESITEDVDVTSAEVPVVETVNALAKDKFEDQETEDKKERDIIETVGINEISIGQHSDVCQSEMLKDAEKDDLEGIRQGTELEAGMNAIPALSNTKKNVGSDFYDHPQGNMDAEVSVDSNDKAITSEVITTEISEMKSTDVVPLSDNERMAADGIPTTEPTNETIDESLLVNEESSSPGILKTPEDGIPAKDSTTEVADESLLVNEESSSQGILKTPEDGIPAKKHTNEVANESLLVNEESSSPGILKTPEDGIPAKEHKNEVADESLLVNEESSSQGILKTPEDGIPAKEHTNEVADESLLVNEESSSPGILKTPEDGIPAKDSTTEVADESLLVNEESSSQGILKTPEDGIPAKEHTNEVADESLLVNEESSSPGILKTPEDGIPAKDSTTEVADESLLVNEESSSQGILKTPEDGIPAKEHKNEVADESLLVNEESSSPGILKTPEDGISAKEHKNEVADESLLVNEESSSQGILKTPEDGIPAKEHTNDVADESLLVNEESSSQGILKTPEDGIPAKEHTNEVADESLLVNEESHSQVISETAPKLSSVENNSPTKCANESAIVTATDYPASSTYEVVSSTQLELESRDETALKDVTEVLTAEVSDGQEVILPLSPSDVSQHVADEHDVSNVEQMIAIDAGHSESLTQQPALAEGCVSTTPFENGHKETVELKIAECSSDSSDFVPMDTNMGGGAPEDNLESLSQDSIAPEEKTFGPSTENVVVSGESVEEKVSRPSSGQEISEHSQNIEAVPDLSVDLTVMTQEHSDPEPLSEESIDMPESRNDITVTEISDLSTETPEVSIEKTEINIPLHISSEVHKEIVTISVAKEEGTSESSIEKVKVASEVPAENGVDDVIISEVAITEPKAECEGVGTSDDPKSISQPEKEIPENKQEEIVESATITSELTHGGNSSTSATEATESDQFSIVTTEHAEISSVTQTTVIVETTETKTEIIETDYDKSKEGGELTSEIDELPKVDEETDKKDDNPTEVPLKDEESEVIVAPDDRDEEEKGQKGIAMDKAQEEKEIICSVEQSDECREGTENAGNREEEPIPEKTGMKRSQGCCVIS